MCMFLIYNNKYNIFYLNFGIIYNKYCIKLKRG